MILLSAGGDKRMTFLTNSFLPLCRRVYQLAGDPGSPPANGVKKLDYLFWVQEQPDILLLPLPFSRDGVRLAQNAGKEEIKLNHLLDLCHRDTVVCGGMLIVMARPYTTEIVIPSSRAVTSAFSPPAMISVSSAM